MVSALPYTECGKPCAAAYAFTDLQSFLDIYYAGASVLLHEQDFYDMAWAYFLSVPRPTTWCTRELFFDPQTHTERGVPMATVVSRACTAPVWMPAPNWA